MAVTQQKFEALIERLENFARRQPALYRLCVGLLALLGYAYIFLILASLLDILAGLVLLVVSSGRINFYIVKFGILIFIPALIILKSLWVHIPPPTGVALSRQDAPHLFEMVDELTLQLQAPRFHHILLSEDFNAAVVQRPRLGVFGWQQNYLLLGLPLMQALSPEQLRAVVAHELGHLSGNHSRFAGWIYRIQKTWVQILERLHASNHSGSSILFDSFFNWYAPFFSAYSFVLRRMNEYEADRCAAELAGAQNAAEALINVEIRARFLQSSFWPNITKQVAHQVEPPPAIYTNMFKAFGAGVSPEEGTIWLDRALAQKTDREDTHPCLGDRLSALGYLKGKGQQIPLPAAFEISAAQHFLGNAVNKFTADFDRAWKQEIATPWRQRYAYAQETQNKLKELDKKAQNQQLTLEESWNRACWTAEFKGNDAAIPLLREILIERPAHASAHFLLGQILLEQNELTGIGHIEKAMEKDPENVIPGCEIIYLFFKEQGKTEKAKAYRDRAQQHYDLLLMAQQERSAVKAGDRFTPHNLLPATLAPVNRQLSGYDAVKEAYLVRKVVTYFPEQPFYVLAIKRNQSFFEIDKTGGDSKLVNALANELQFPSTVYIIILNDSTKNLEKILRKIEGAAIYQK